MENQKLLEKEESAIKKTTGVTTKVTRSQIEEAKVLTCVHVLTGMCCVYVAMPLNLFVCLAEIFLWVGTATAMGPPLEQNPNLLELERQRQGEVQARSIDEAIDVLGGGSTPIDRHPERRMKAAYTAFEERELPRLKAENPNLRLSQLKQLLRKEWMKSPENPMIQQLAHNT